MGECLLFCPWLSRNQPNLFFSNPLHLLLERKEEVKSKIRETLNLSMCSDSSRNTKKSVPVPKKHHNTSIIINVFALLPLFSLSFCSFVALFLCPFVTLSLCPFVPLLLCPFLPLSLFPYTLSTIHFTLYTIHYKLYTFYYTQYTIDNTIHYTL